MDDIARLIKKNFIDLSSKSIIKIDYDYKLIFEDYSIKNIEYDIKSFTFYDFIGLLKFLDNKIFNFDFIDNLNTAFGEGATRQVYQKLANEIVGDILKKTNEYFVDIDENNEFWDNLSNIKAFARFILLLLESECVLPYHLPPRYLEILSGYDLTIKELEYFYDKYYPGVLNNLNEIYKNDPKKFEKLDIGFKTYEQMLRSEVLNESEKTNIIYYELSEQQKDLFNGANIVTIDYVLSGEYKIDPTKVIKNMKIICKLKNNEQYISLWSDFIISLNSEELKQLLLAFTNTTLLKKKNKIKINIRDDMIIDIRILTCINSVDISNKLFENFETLSNLKKYIVNTDSLNEPSNINSIFRQQPQIFSNNESLYPNVINYNSGWSGMIGCNMNSTNHYYNLYPNAINYNSGWSRMIGYNMNSTSFIYRNIFLDEQEDIDLLQTGYIGSITGGDLFTRDPLKDSIESFYFKNIGISIKNIRISPVRNQIMNIPNILQGPSQLDIIYDNIHLSSKTLFIELEDTINKYIQKCNNAEFDKLTNNSVVVKSDYNFLKYQIEVEVWHENIYDFFLQINKINSSSNKMSINKIIQLI